MATIRHAYGGHPDQFGELTMPGGEPYGVAVLVHGGFWKPEYGIEYARPLVASLAAAGWAVWAIEYRRGSGAADTLADVRTAISERPVDSGAVSGPVVAIGHSAGGHLATWAAAQGVGITHVVAQAGVLDLVAAHEAGLGDGAVRRFLGHAPGDADGPLDPIRTVPLGLPVWCIHGRADDTVPVSQSRSYLAAARAAGGAAELVEIDGDHFTVIDPESAAWATTLEHLRSLVPARQE